MRLIFSFLFCHWFLRNSLPSSPSFVISSSINHALSEFVESVKLMASPLWIAEMKPLNLLNTILKLFLLCLFSKQVISNPTYFDRNCLIDVGNYTMNSTHQKLRTPSTSPSPTSQPNQQVEPSTTSRHVIKACTKYIALLYCIGNMSSQECHGCIQDAAPMIF